jgi:hypothetical protein
VYNAGHAEGNERILKTSPEVFECPAKRYKNYINQPSIPNCKIMFGVAETEQHRTCSPEVLWKIMKK